MHQPISSWRSRCRRIGAMMAFWLAFAAAASPIAYTLTSSERRELQREGRVIIDLLQNLHYSARHFHEIEGGEIIDAFLTRFDPDGLVLTKADVDAIHGRFDRSLKNVYLLKGDDQPALEIFDRVKEKLTQRMAWVDSRLRLMLNLEDPAVLERQPRPERAATAAELDVRWEQRIKSAVINEILRGRERDEAIEEVSRSFHRWLRQIEGISASDVRTQFYESLLNLFDPHSGYFGRDDAAEFDIMMKGAVAGIGLDVRMKDGRCVVAGVLPGGPAEVQGQVRTGDEILALGEEGGAWTATEGRRLEQILARMRGRPGTNLRVAYRTPKAPERRECTLERREVVLIQQKARGGICRVPNGNDATLVGWIDLPAFYLSGDEADRASATADVRDLLEQMKARGVKAVLLDLRRNGGGAVPEAVGLAGLFLPSGVVMYTRGLEGKPAELAVEPHVPTFTGPLVVLTSRHSASASEVFAAALQFHRRAVIVGATTYGKGTLQNYIDLTKTPLHAPDAPRWGTVRVTTQRFYGPDGRSPQRSGVTPDILREAPAAEGEKYEADLPQALSEDRLTTATAKPAELEAGLTPDLLQALRKNSQARSESLPEFAVLRRAQELAARSYRPRRESLILSERLKEQSETDAVAADVRREMFGFAADAGFADEEVDTAAVRKTVREHNGRARAMAPEGTDLARGWLHDAHYFRTGGKEGLREVPLERFPYRIHAGTSEALAALFESASGVAITAEQMARALRRAALAEDLTADGLVDIFAEAIDPTALRTRVGHGVVAVLGRMVESDARLAYPHERTDVEFREALRIAADWLGRSAAFAK